MATECGPDRQLIWFCHGFELPSKIDLNLLSGYVAVDSHLSVIIRLEARLQRNIAFTSECHRTVFMRSATTPPKVDRFGLNLNCLGLAMADFGRNPHRSKSRRARRNFGFFVM